MWVTPLPDPPPQGGRERRESPPVQTTTFASRAQPSGKSRYVERLEAVMRQEAHVALEQLPQIRDAIFQHGDAIDTHAPGKALILVRIDTAGAQHVRMNHAAAQNLQ